MSDYEVWHAVHDDCPPYGCGKCVGIDVDWDADLIADLERAAEAAGEPLDVFIHKAVVMGMKHEGFGN